MRKPIDWKKLTDDAQTAAIREQRADYIFFQKLFGISPGVVVQLLKKLARGGIVAQAKDRTWHVLVAADGVTRREPPEPPYKGRKKKALPPKKAPKAAPKLAKARKAAPAKPTPSVHLNGAEKFSDASKSALLKNLAGALPSGGNARAMLTEIISDFGKIAQARNIMKALE